MSDGVFPPSVTFWVDTTTGAPPQVVVFGEGKDVFAILARSFKAVNDAAKRTLDNAKRNGENSSSSSPSSNQCGNAPGPTPLVVPPSFASQDKVPGAVPSSEQNSRPGGNAVLPAAPTGNPRPVASERLSQGTLSEPPTADKPREDAAGRGANEHPAGNRTNAGTGARAPDQPRDVGRTPTQEAGASERPSTERDGAEGRGGRGIGQQAGAGGLDAAPRSGVRDTSMAAYRALEWSGKLAAQQMTVLALFLANPTARRTRQEIASYTGLSINAVCGRVNELMSGPFFVLVEDEEKKTCAITKNRVTALRLARVDEVHPKEEETV